MIYTDKYKTELLEQIGRNLTYYRYRCNNANLLNERGFVSMEKLAEEIDSSVNMLYNLTAKNVEQGVSLAFIDKLARALDISLHCFFLKEPIPNPPKYGEE